MSFPIQKYLTLYGVPEEGRIPNANEPGDFDTLYRFEFDGTKVDVFADSADDAFETAVEWLDEHAPGHLVTVGKNELMAAAADAGLPYPEDGDFDSDEGQKIIELAEQGLTHISHTTLKHGSYLRADEWTFREVTSW